MIEYVVKGVTYKIPEANEQEFLARVKRKNDKITSRKVIASAPAEPDKAWQPIPGKTTFIVNGVRYDIPDKNKDKFIALAQQKGDEVNNINESYANAIKQAAPPTTAEIVKQNITDKGSVKLINGGFLDTIDKSVDRLKKIDARLDELKKVGIHVGNKNKEYEQLITVKKMLDYWLQPNTHSDKKERDILTAYQETQKTKALISVLAPSAEPVTTRSFVVVRPATNRSVPPPNP